LSLTFPVDAKLKDGSSVQLVLADNQDIEPLRSLYRVIVEEGTSYPHDRFPDQDAFMDYWFRGKSTVAAYVPDRAGVAGMAGAFYLKPNWPGRSTRCKGGRSLCFTQTCYERRMANDEIGDRLSSMRFPSLRRKEFVCFGGDRHEHCRRDAEPRGELGDLADVQVALAR